MRKIFLALMLAYSMVGYSQNPTDSGNANDTSIDINAKAKEISHLSDSLRQITWERENSSGLNYLMEMQKEQHAKEKRNAYIRIGLGIFFLIILVIGWRRRTRKK